MQNLKNNLMRINIFRLLVSISLSMTAGILGSFFTVASIPTWYAFLNKPFFSPPNFVFGPVWTILYTLIGISFYRIWMKENRNKTKKKNAFILFFIHLLFNTTWSIVFFGFQQIFWGLLNILILWALIVAVIMTFYKIDKKASLILIPYLLWVTFATILNTSIWLLNP